VSRRGQATFNCSCSGAAARIASNPLPTIPLLVARERLTREGRALAPRLRRSLSEILAFSRESERRCILPKSACRYGPTYEEEDTCMSAAQRLRIGPHQLEEDTCMSYEEEETCRTAPADRAPPSSWAE